jgi:hypothetical protein
VKAERVGKLHIVPAAADWVVALLPKSVERSKKIDLGGPGFDGFQDAGKHDNIIQQKLLPTAGTAQRLSKANGLISQDSLSTAQFRPSSQVRISSLHVLHGSSISDFPHSFLYSDLSSRSSSLGRFFRS